MEQLVKKCLEVFKKADQCSSEYDLACFVMKHTLSSSHMEQLEQLISGPVWDGNVLSKHHRDDLLEMGLAVKVCAAGAQGYNAATYRGWEVLSA